MVAVSEAALSFQKALIIASGPAMLEKIVRPVKDEGMAVNACESLDDARKLYQDQALIILPLKEETREETKRFIGWLRETSHPPYILAVGRCDEKYRQALVSSFQLNDLISLPYTESEVRERLSSYRHWCRLPDTTPRNMPRATLNTTSKLSFFSSPPPAGAAKAEDAPEVTFCREAPIGIAMFDRQVRYIYSNPRWEQQFNIHENVLGKSQFEIFPNLHPDWSKIYQNCLTGETRRGREVITSETGVPTEMRWEVRPWRFRNGQIGGITIAFEEAVELASPLVVPAAPEAASPKEPSGPSRDPLEGLDVLLISSDADGLITQANAEAQSHAAVPILLGKTKFAEAFPLFEDRPTLTSAKSGYVAWTSSPAEGSGAIQRMGVFLDQDQIPSPSTEVGGQSVEELRAAREQATKVAEELADTRSALATLRERGAAEAEELRTLREQSEARRSQEKTLAVAPVVLWKANALGELIWVNQQWEDFWGKKLAGEKPQGWLGGIEDEQARETLRKAIEAAAKNAVALKERVWVQDGKGAKRQIEWQALPLKDSEGLCLGLSGTLRDVTEEVAALSLVKQTIAPDLQESGADLVAKLTAKLPAWRAEQEKITKETRLLREALDHAAFGVVLLGPAAEPLLSNAKHKELLGYSLEEAVDFEGWIRRGCPDPEQLKTALRIWQEDIWRRQLTKVLTLTNSEGITREIEVQPLLFVSDNRLLLTLSDVTEGKRGEAALRDSEIRFRALFRDSAVGIALIDAEQKFYDINQALERILDVSKRKLLSGNFDECIHPEDLPKKNDLVEQLLSSPKRCGQIELRLAPKPADEDKTSWVRLNVSLVRDADQRVLFTAYFVHDITEQKEVQAQLLVSKEQNRALLEAIPDLIMLIDRQGRIIDFKPSDSVPIHGSEENTLGQPLERVIPAFSGHATRLIEEAYRSEDVIHFRFDVREGDTARRYDARIVACIPNNAVVTVQDITERMQIPESVRLQAMGFANLPDAAMVADYSGEIIEWNQAAERMFGHTKPEAQALSVPAVFGVASMEAFTKLLSEGGQEGPFTGKVKFPRKNGSSGMGEVIFRPLKSPVGSVSGHVVFVRPPSDAAPPLENIRAEIKAEAMSRMVPQMHERLCANLQIIGTLLNLQYKTQSDNETRAALQTSRNRVRALTLLHDLIRTREDEEAVNFRRFTELLSDELLTNYDAIDRITVVSQIQNAPLDLHIATPLALILNELVTNAIVHAFLENEPGQILIVLELRGEHGVLTVKDNGRGMKDEPADSRRAGLGLQISQNLAKQIGGSLEKVEAQETQFRVHFSTAVRK